MSDRVLIPEARQLRDTVRCMDDKHHETTILFDHLVRQTADLIKAIHAKNYPSENFYEWLRGQTLREITLDAVDIEHCVLRLNAVDAFSRRLQELLNEGNSPLKVFVSCWVEMTRKMELRISF